MLFLDFRLLETVVSTFVAASSNSNTNALRFSGLQSHTFQLHHILHHGRSSVLIIRWCGLMLLRLTIHKDPKMRAARKTGGDGEYKWRG